MPNEAQIEYWNDVAGPRWVEQRERLDRFMEGMTRALLGRADIQPGERVLDVGCGTGTTTLEIARRAGAGGRVTGIDIARNVLSEARERARRSELSIEFVEGDAQHAALGTFDAIVSRFGVMFFDDPIAAFENLRGALAPGGRLLFSAWQPRELNEWFSIPSAAIAELVELPRPEPNAPGPFGLSDSTHLATVLASAGFEDFALERVEDSVEYGSVEEALDFLCNVGPVALALRECEPARHPELLNLVRSALAARAHEGRVRFASAAWLVHAR